MRTIEIEDLDEFDARSAGATTMRGWQLQDLDLTGREEVLAGLDPAGALLLGCTLSPDAEDDLRRRGALVFPTVPRCRSTRTEAASTPPPSSTTVSGADTTRPRTRRSMPGPWRRTIPSSAARVCATAWRWHCTTTRSTTHWRNMSHSSASSVSWAATTCPGPIRHMPMLPASAPTSSGRA